MPTESNYMPKRPPIWFLALIGGVFWWVMDGLDIPVWYRVVVLAVLIVIWLSWRVIRSWPYGFLALYGSLAGLVLGCAFFVYSGPSYPAAILTATVGMNGLSSNSPQTNDMHVSIRNESPAEIARDLRWEWQAKVTVTPMSAAQESQFLDELESLIYPTLSRAIVYPTNPGHSSGISDKRVIEISDVEIQQLRTGNKRIYVMVVGSWEDKNGQQPLKYCAYWNYITHAWRVCETHNEAEIRQKSRVPALLTQRVSRAKA